MIDGILDHPDVTDLMIHYPSRSKIVNSICLFLLLLGSACSAQPLGPASISIPTALYLVTVPPDATATPTPFQPVSETETPSSPSLLTGTPVELPSTTDIFQTPTATFDPDALLIPPSSTQQSFYAPPYAPNPSPVLTDKDTVTFALLGSDKRPGQTFFRTDTIVIAAIRPASGQVTLISVPRDLYVYIPNVGMDRINTAYEYGQMYNYPGGGPALFKDTFLYNLGIRIDHLAIVDFDGFRKMVDTIGGLDVPVYCAYTDWHLIDPSYDPENENNWSLYTVGPGIVHMNGDLSLWYARSRKKSSDFDRGRRSQEVLRALYARALQTGAISKIPQLYAEFNSAVITDLTLPDLLQLSPLALHLKNADIRSYYISRDDVSPWITAGGASVLLPNGPAIQSMVQQALSPSPRSPSIKAFTVEVRNGTANPGWDSLAAERLNYAGYNTRLAPADRQDYNSSLLYDLAATADPTTAASLLGALGLPSTAYISAPMTADVNYVLIVGSDYQQCFKPGDLSP
jgi:LCP family protein required for cell wall assembly